MAARASRKQALRRWGVTRDDDRSSYASPSKNETWRAPWTIELTLQRDDGYGMFEYACHERNLAMFNILSGHRAEERKAAAKEP